MNIAIWGMGVSGISALKYLTKLNKDQLFLINQGDSRTWNRREEILSIAPNSSCYSEVEAAGELYKKIDLIVLAPGIDPENEYLQKFKDVKKICEIELVFEKVNCPIIALTGTNGKTTTVTMIKEALNYADKKVFLGGNIGTPLCEMFLNEEKFDFIVLELSSFQLELMDKFRANIAVVLNITKSHMERYKSFSEYKEAKLNIVNNQKETDLFIAPKEFFDIDCKSQKEELTPTSDFDFSNSHLFGEHYKINISVVKKVLSFFDISNTDKIVQSLVDNFMGVEFRLQFLRDYKNVQIFNDGKSTNTAATISALNSFKTKKIGLILGGKLRDLTQDFSFVNDLENVEVYSFGEASKFIGKQVKSCREFELLNDVVLNIDWNSLDVLLFSPAFPSFDHYKNYIERAKHFDELINSLK